jgi:hypothetical protein
MVQWGIVAREGAEPQQSAKATPINDQMQWSFEFEN